MRTSLRLGFLIGLSVVGMGLMPDGNSLRRIAAGAVFMNVGMVYVRMFEGK